MAPIFRKHKLTMLVAIDILNKIETIETEMMPIDPVRGRQIVNRLQSEYAECMAQMLELLPSGEEVVNG